MSGKNPGRRGYDLVGQRFGRLLVVGMADKDPRYSCRCWSCVCDCGVKHIVRSSNLIQGITRSCGCLRREDSERRRLADRQISCGTQASVARGCGCDLCVIKRDQINADKRQRHCNLPIDVRRERWLRKYGITLEQHTEMLRRQDGKCAICRTDNWGGRWNFPNVDHDHETGRIRGLLCLACNRGVGNFRDSLDLLSRAIDYLKNSDG